MYEMCEIFCSSFWRYWDAFNVVTAESKCIQCATVRSMVHWVNIENTGKMKCIRTEEICKNGKILFFTVPLTEHLEQGNTILPSPF